MKHVTILAILALAAGCSPAVPSLSPRQAASAATENLCWGYGQYGSLGSGATEQSRQAIRAELVKRGALNAQEWELVDRGALNPGMRRCAVTAELGRPIVDDGNQVGSEVLGFHDGMFVTLRDGVLVSYDDHSLQSR